MKTDTTDSINQSSPDQVREARKQEPMTPEQLEYERKLESKAWKSLPKATKPTINTPPVLKKSL